MENFVSLCDIEEFKNLDAFKQTLVALALGMLGISLAAMTPEEKEYFSKLYIDWLVDGEPYNGEDEEVAEVLEAVKKALGNEE